ncbi:hypothetical protein DSL72_007318 [Monilinia vaccinii-corymbosi]|uniref:Uncharacterized protein n=1 Tax=Monilinia vaccinii-corymbosi TaxID=61207 RepID=A0A8A3PMH8_9HELO|nr:hypothetical protein DSL72_007318 [Monilinia vaccinii-corymbosi]
MSWKHRKLEESDDLEDLITSDKPPTYTPKDLARLHKWTINTSRGIGLSKISTLLHADLIKYHTPPKYFQDRDSDGNPSIELLARLFHIFNRVFFFTAIPRTKILQRLANLPYPIPAHEVLVHYKDQPDRSELTKFLASARLSHHNPEVDDAKSPCITIYTDSKIDRNGCSR